MREIDMALDMARMRGWRVEYEPRTLKPSIANSVTMFGHVKREPYYRVFVPFGLNTAAHIWDIEDNPLGAAKLIGMLMKTAEAV